MFMLATNDGVLTLPYGQISAATPVSSVGCGKKKKSVHARETERYDRDQTTHDE